MSASSHAAMTALAGIQTLSNNSSQWDFHGKIISPNQYRGDFDADLAAVLVEDRSATLDLATVKSSHHMKPANQFARPASSGHRVSWTTCVASSYADTEASMRPNYVAPSHDSMSQYSTFVPTPTTSDGQRVDENTFSHQNDSLEHHQQQHAYSDFSTYISGPTLLDSWYDKPERHEHVSYMLSDTATDPTVQKKMKKSNGNKIQKRK